MPLSRGAFNKDEVERPQGCRREEERPEKEDDETWQLAAEEKN